MDFESVNLFFCVSDTLRKIFEFGFDFLKLSDKFKIFTESGLAKSQDAIDFLKKFSAEKNATPTQISLAWMLCEKKFIIPIPGSRKLEHLKENFASGEIRLSAEEISKINAKLSTTNFEVFGGSKIVKK